MYLQLDSNSTQPVYVQIMEQIKRAIFLGVYEVGKSIPTIKEIALELEVNPNTVNRAIRELEREKIVKTFVGKGTFVMEDARKMIQESHQDKSESLTQQFVKDMRWLGWDKAKVIEFIEESWKEQKK